jgi:hypothetical protein
MSSWHAASLVKHRNNFTCTFHIMENINLRTLHSRYSNDKTEENEMTWAHTKHDRDGRRGWRNTHEV